jgi:hypothetical protein
MTDFNEVTKYRMSPMDIIELTNLDSQDSYSFSNAQADSTYSLQDVVLIDDHACERIIGTKFECSFIPLQNNLVELETAIANLKSANQIGAKLKLAVSSDLAAGRSIDITISRVGVSRKITKAALGPRMELHITGAIPPNPAMPPEYITYP